MSTSLRELLSREQSPFPTSTANLVPSLELLLLHPPGSGAPWLKAQRTRVGRWAWQAAAAGALEGTSLLVTPTAALAF